MATRLQCEQCNYFDARNIFCARFFSAPNFDGTTCNPGSEKPATQPKQTRYVFDSQPTEEELMEFRKPYKVQFIMYLVLLPLVILMVPVMCLCLGLSWDDFIAMFQNPRLVGKLSALLLSIPAMIWLLKTAYDKLHKPYLKQITIDLSDSSITYKDMLREEHFSGREVKDWQYNNSAPGKKLADLIRLHKGTEFNLFGYYKEDLHAFLLQHQEDLNLPSPVEKKFGADIIQAQA